MSKKENRFDSARSKLGEFHSCTQIGKFLKHMSEDILEDIGLRDKIFVKTLNLEVSNFLKGRLA